MMGFGRSMFDELVIGSSRARNSIVRAATAESLATADGCPTYELADKYAELAAGGVGTIITGYAYVMRSGKPSEGALGIYDDSFAEEYRRLVHAAHSGGARIVLQLVYGGSKSKLAADDERRLAPMADAVANGRFQGAFSNKLGTGGAGVVEDALSEYGQSVSSIATGEDAFAAKASNASILGASSIEHPRTHLVPQQASKDDLGELVRAFGRAAARAGVWVRRG